MTARQTTLALAALLALALVGCGPKEPKSEDPKPGVASGVTDPGAGPAVPADLQTAAYEYQGMNHDDLMTYDVVMASLVGEQEGTQQIKLEKVEDGVATYQVLRTGGLAQLGVDTRELRKDGVYTVSASLGILEAPALELPADLAVGKEWSAPMNMDKVNGTDQKVESIVASKAVREQKVKVPAGEFDCIVIESTIDATISGSIEKKLNGKSVTKLVSSYSKGVGLIKLTGTITRADGEKSNVSIELKSRTPMEE